MRRVCQNGLATDSAKKSADENVRLRFMVDELLKEKQRDKKTIASLEQMILKLVDNNRVN